MENIVVDFNELYRSGSLVVGLLLGLFASYLAHRGTNEEKRMIVELLLEREQDLINQINYKDEKINMYQSFIDEKLMKKSPPKT